MIVQSYWNKFISFFKRSHHQIILGSPKPTTFCKGKLLLWYVRAHQKIEPAWLSNKTTRSLFSVENQEIQTVVDKWSILMYPAYFIRNDMQIEKIQQHKAKLERDKEDNEQMSSNGEKTNRTGTSYWEEKKHLRGNTLWSYLPLSKNLIHHDKRPRVIAIFSAWVWHKMVHMV